MELLEEFARVRKTRPFGPSTFLEATISVRSGGVIKSHVWHPVDAEPHVEVIGQGRSEGSFKNEHAIISAAGFRKAEFYIKLPGRRVPSPFVIFRLLHEDGRFVSIHLHTGNNPCVSLTTCQNANSFHDGEVPYKSERFDYYKRKIEDNSHLRAMDVLAGLINSAEPEKDPFISEHEVAAFKRAKKDLLAAIKALSKK